MRGAVLLAVLGLAFGVSRAEVRVARVFGDHMVLQRGMPVPVWGWAAPGEALTVTLGETRGEAVAAADGRWLVHLPTQGAGGPTALRVSGPANEVTFQDVLVGEVWLCSGQSNMQFAARSALNAEEEIKQADFPEIRLLTVWPSRQMEEPLSDLSAPVWRACSPETAGGFSAVGYFFGRELRRELKVPIGLINASYGGTSIEAWISREKLLEDDSTAAIVKEWDRVKADVPAMEADYAAKTKAWEEAAAQAKAAGKPAPERSRFHRFARPQARPAAFYNTCIAPLIPFATRGVIWYQGESGGNRTGRC